jgi:hypothetical protein
MRVNKITLIISLIGVNLLFATDISPYNLLFFLLTTRIWKIELENSKTKMIE